MAHQHPVVDSDIRFTINPNTRAISRVNATKSSLIVGDHNSERFTFEIPKIVEGHDMSLCNVVRVHYLNTSSDNKAIQSLGVYEVDDFDIDSENENNMTFSWLISSKATQHVGPLAFTVQFACMTGFKVDYSWQSGVFSGITVSNAVNGAEVVIEEYADILRKWWEQLYASSELPIEFMTVEDFSALNGDTKNGTLYLFLNDPAVDDLKKIPSIEESITSLTTEVQTNKQGITNLNTGLVNLDQKVESAKQSITNLNNNLDELTGEVRINLSNLEEDIGSLEEEIGANKQSIENLATEIQAKEQRITEVAVMAQMAQQSVTDLSDDMGKTISNMSKEIESANSKLEWCDGEHIKLYEYDTETSLPNCTGVHDGLYVIRVVRQNGENPFSSTSLILDTYNKENTSTSFSIPDSDGSLHHYVIHSKVVESLGLVTLTPYEIRATVDLDVSWYRLNWTKSTTPAQEIVLYGRCIYQNPRS